MKAVLHRVSISRVCVDCLSPFDCLPSLCIFPSCGRIVPPTVRTGLTPGQDSAVCTDAVGCAVASRVRTLARSRDAPEPECHQVMPVDRVAAS
jgi:hypothetical protein